MYRLFQTVMILCSWCYLSRATLTQKSTVEVAMNEIILMDSMQINPGDSYSGQQQQGSHYSNPHYLKHLGYTARSTSMEQSPTICMTYRLADRVRAKAVESLLLNTSNNYGVFQNHRNSAAWVTAYCQGLHRILNETLSAGLEAFFFTDMIVFPIALMELYPEVMHFENATKKVSILYNNYTEYLLQIMFEEWIDTFPQTSGIVVRTGETYTFDTPYHMGSSPTAYISNVTEQNHVWVQYINLLRTIVCEKYQMKLIFRTWFSLTDARSYIDVTEKIQPHPFLYFSIKHTSGDFFRQMSPNPLLHIGNHSQIVEIQIQREYEGKGSYPLYLFEHIVLGDRSSGSNHSLSKLFPSGCNATSIIKGLWTWSRGGGWWGPYIQGAEFWIDLNVKMFTLWWNHDHCTTTIETVHELFQKGCIDTVLASQENNAYRYATFVDDGNRSVMVSLKGACSQLREVMLLADQALLYGRYCLEVDGAYSNCWIWTRDDRIGGLNELQAHMNYLRNNATRISMSLRYKQQSLVLWKEAMTLYESGISSIFATIDQGIDRQIRNSFLYAQSYFCIIESAWRSLIYGTLMYDARRTNHTLLFTAISDYDDCWNVFRAIGLTTPQFPSLYKGIYWNFPYETENEGIDATINRLRKLVDGNAEKNLIYSQF